MQDPDLLRGALLGLALGDALGAPYEGGLLERAVWWGLGLGRPGLCRYSDDGEMAVILAEAVADRGRVVPDELAQRFAREASWARGYGPGARRVLKRIGQGVSWREASVRVYPEGSFGNGAAMRVAPLGVWLADDPARLTLEVTASALITHAHPLGVEGALLMARAAAAASQGCSPGALWATLGAETPAFGRRIELAQALLREAPTPAAVASALGRGVQAEASVVTAIYLACRFQAAPFLDLVAFAIAIGGDTDTIAAMAGALWGAWRGGQALPESALARLEARSRFEAAAARLALTPR